MDFAAISKPHVALAIEHPFDERTFRLPQRTSVEESLPVEVIARRTVIVRRRDDRSFEQEGGTSQRRGRGGQDRASFHRSRIEAQLTIRNRSE